MNRRMECLFLCLLLALCPAGRGEESALSPAVRQALETVLPAGSRTLAAAEEAEEALALVRQGEHTMLWIIRRTEAGWRCFPGAEGLPERTEVARGEWPVTGEACFLLTTGEGCFYVRTEAEKGWLLGFSPAGDAGMLVDAGRPNTLTLRRTGESGRVRLTSLRCEFSPLLERVELKDFPASEEEAAAYARAHPLPADTTLRLIGGMNLRAEPTSLSESIAVYHRMAPAVYLGEQAGPAEPWIHVRVGAEEGWVSASYVFHLSDPAAWSWDLPAAEAAGPVTVYPHRGGGDVLMTLPAGTPLWVLTEEKEGWVQVAAESGEVLGWTALKDLRTAPTRLQLKYGR